MTNRTDENTPITYLKNKVREFVKERNWEKYHNLKDLAIALTVEATELLDIFKWRPPEKVQNNPQLMQQVKEELADIVIYALRLADVAQIDVAQAVIEKLAKSARKYPPGKQYDW